MRVDATNDDCLIIEKYSSDFSTIIFSKEIPFELPIFGGFYCGKNNLFVMYGEKNLEDSEEKEVVRVVKYDYSWNKQGSTSFYGINTYVPFASGSSSFDETEDILYIHTSHTMFKTEDGLHHQANLTFAIDKNSMKTISDRHIIWSVYCGYVSHSFNQFIKIDGKDILTVDHGDAYPRSVVLIKYPEDSSKGIVDTGGTNYVNLIEIPGEIGENQTGITVGGFEVSKNNYLVAATQVDPTGNPDNYLNKQTKNLYIMIQPKNNLSSLKTQRVTLTKHKEGDAESADNPFLIKISDNKFLVMWESVYKDSTHYNKYYKNEIFAVLIDENGNKLTDIKKFNGTLSDCQPIFYNGKVFWYSAGYYEVYDFSNGIYEAEKESNATFYEIEVIENGSSNVLVFSDNPGDVNKKTDAKQVRDYVTRFYKVVLGRDGEESGINDWTNKLVTKEKTGCDVAKGFAMSPEFTKKNLSNDEFLKTMYKAFFNREPDESGYNNWIQKLNSGVSREAVIAGFVNSYEFQNLCAKYNINPGTMVVSEEGQKITQPQQPQQKPPLKLDASGVDDAKLDEYVERLYTEILGRPSESDGKAYWKKVIIEGQDKDGNIYDAATAARKGFFESVEYRNLGRNDDEFLTDLYHAFFGREPDESGYADWQNRMKNEGYSRQRVIDEGFGRSPEFKNLLKSYGFKIIE